MQQVGNTGRFECLNFASQTGFLHCSSKETEPDGSFWHGCYDIKNTVYHGFWDKL